MIGCSKLTTAAVLHCFVSETLCAPRQAQGTVCSFRLTAQYACRFQQQSPASSVQLGGKCCSCMLLHGKFVEVIACPGLLSTVWSCQFVSMHCSRRQVVLSTLLLFKFQTGFLGLHALHTLTALLGAAVKCTRWQACTAHGKTFYDLLLLFKYSTLLLAVVMRPFWGERRQRKQQRK